MDKGLVTKYWKEVLRRAFEPVWKEMTMRVLIIALILLIISVGVSGIFLTLGLIQNDFFTDRVAEAQTGISAFCVSLTVFAVLFMMGIYKAPVQMYEELGGFVENPFLLDVYQSKRERKENEDKWASIAVKNNSASENIEDCFLKLQDIVDLKTGRSVIEDVQNLTWSGKEQNKEISGNQPIRIVADHEAICDVARTNVKDLWGVRAYYTTWFGGQELNQGDYLLKIIVYGNFRTHPVHYTYQTVLHFYGGNKISIDKPNLIRGEQI